uniref:Uncharacterized protein n=1 Tax=Panagrolaimus superbus TaxID=310955 RepID=A0A914YYY1_9BILA
MRYWLLLIFVGFLGFEKFEIVESRRGFGSTHSVIFPKFYPNPNKINHKFLPKYEYTVFYEKVTLPPSTTPTTTTVLPSTITLTTTLTHAATTSTTTPPPPTTTTESTTIFSTPATPTTTTFPQPFITDIPLTTTTTTLSLSSTISSTTTTTDETQIPSSRDGNFDWIGALIVLLITLAAIAFFVIRRKCSSPSGTYRIPKTNLVPKEYYVNFCKIDDEFIEINAKALYGPSYVVTSVENQNFEEINNDETCL